MCLSMTMKVKLPKKMTSSNVYAKFNHRQNSQVKVPPDLQSRLLSGLLFVGLEVGDKYHFLKMKRC